MKLVIIALLVLSSVAYAEPVVLAVDGKDIYVDVGAKDGDATALVRVVEALEGGHLIATWVTRGVPEIENDYFAVEVRELDRMARQVDQRERWGDVAGQGRGRQRFPTNARRGRWRGG